MRELINPTQPDTGKTRRPHLVVVPSSVLDNWASELEKFCPALYFVKYHGSQKERSAMRQSLNAVASGNAKEDMPVSDDEVSRFLSTRLGRHGRG